MADKALYFPYINVPDTRWFTRLLLYWDKVGSIVPYEYAYNPRLLSPYMRDLVAAELVELITPAEHVYHVPHFTSAFIEPIERKMKISRFSGSRRAIEAPPIRLHIEKLGDISGELLQRGLITPAGYPWFDAQPWVGSAFMAYLASTLGRIPEINADPVTNERATFSLLGGGSDFARARSRARSVILKRIMPSPAGPIAIRDIADFKESYGHLLQQLRRSIEGKCIEIANIHDAAARDERARQVAEELADEIGELVDAMQRRWPRIVMMALAPILSAVVGLAGGGSAAALASAGFSLASAVYGAFDALHEGHAFASKPLAYLAYTSRHFPPMTR